MNLALLSNPYDEQGFRTCSVTGLNVHRSAERPTKLFVLSAVLSMVLGGIAALFVALTRWEAVGVLSAPAFYKWLSIHAWSLLIFWMVFMEIGILYVGGPMVLGRRLPVPHLAKAGWGLMVGSAGLILYSIWISTPPNYQPLLTSYAPLKSHPLFYVGAILFILGTIVAALPFFVAIWQEKSTHPHKTLPLVTFGAFMTSIIALESLIGGLITYVPTFFWRIGWVEHIDAAWYRQMYWTIGHGTQQINLVAMITIWYFMTYVAGGAEVVSEKVSRTAFILYVFFINMGAAHHLLSDPAVSSQWRMWNCSYATYGAVLASLIHAFALPAGLEVGRRKKGLGDGWFGWLKSAPWSDPGFSATAFSIILFGFLGGTTGVLMGQMQLNTLRHNTLAVPGHFHGTVAVGTTLAFMGFLFYGIKLLFRRDWIAKGLARAQPFFYAGAMSIAVMAMMSVGIVYGLPRRHPSTTSIPGTDFSFAAASPLLAAMGIMAILAILAGAAFVIVAVGSLLFGEELSPADMLPNYSTLPETDQPTHAISMRGTAALTGFFLLVLGALYGLDWMWLAHLWEFGL
ncbi:cytochrome C oxidase subunit I [Salinibacter sp. 10B]|uniref:cbb3-type cytochrome c oxidase subunit I n=1 Tax=Salinibacter sp. 10B TaxID=1923971 RepID=UPI000CF37221|nr:cbb3-type cytochrome c oxidase subunit I [Salinibacter sp. 10B]PQJ33686.1 cytochrome C oxidase subunit I [Salinibacter sp. 10B]